MKTLLILFCSAIGCFSQGFSLTGNAFAHLTVRPPNCWVDVQEFINAGYADQQLTSNYHDFSGHGIRFYDTTGPPGTNFKYYTRFGGVLAGEGPSVAPMQTHPSTLTNVQLHVLGRSNMCTLAIRVRYRTGNAGWIQTGETGPPGTPNYAYCQLTGGTMFFDFGGGGDNRISKTKPSDFDNQLVNVFYIRSGTNAQIWMGGPTGPVTNWHSDLVTAQITNNAANPGNYTQPPTAPFKCMGGINNATNFYVKRILWWDYALPQGDIEHWNRYMTYLP